MGAVSKRRAVSIRGAVSDRGNTVVLKQELGFNVELLGHVLPTKALRPNYPPPQPCYIQSSYLFECIFRITFFCIHVTLSP